MALTGANIPVKTAHLGSYKYKWHISLDPRNTRRRLIVSLDLDPDHAALVHDLLDEPPVLPYHLSY